MNQVMLILLVGAAPLPAAREGSVEAVRIAFVRVGWASATEAARACVQMQPRVCGPLLNRLEQYGSLPRTVGLLTTAQVQQLIQLDRQISPEQPGEFTRRVIERFVSAPLELARYHLEAGNSDSARLIAQQVLEVDPESQEARALLDRAPRLSDAALAATSEPAQPVDDNAETP